MRGLILLLMLVWLAACGKDNTTSSNSQNLNQLNLPSGILSIPKPGVYGGGVALSYNNLSYQMGSLSNEASAYLNSLRNGAVPVAPFGQDNLSIRYRVYFSGTPTQGPCPLNPMAQCSVMNLQSLQAF